MTIKVLLADDQSLVRSGFRMLIDSADDMEAVGEVDNGRDAVAVVRTNGQKSCSAQGSIGAPSGSPKPSWRACGIAIVPCRTSKQMRAPP